MTTIKKLSQHYKLGLTTGAPRLEVEMVLKKLGLEQAFDEIVTIEDYGKSKPDPEGYLLTSKKLGIKPSECMVIEDAPAGIRAAKAAGMRCIGITTTHSREELIESDIVIDELKEIQNTF